MDLEITTHDGLTLKRGLDIAAGFPGADLDDARHLACPPAGYAPVRSARRKSTGCSMPCRASLDMTMSARPTRRAPTTP